MMSALLAGYTRSARLSDVAGDFLGAGDAFDKVDDGTPELRAWNSHEGFGEIEPVRGCQEIGHIARRGSGAWHAAAIRQAFKEKWHRDLEHVSGALQATCAHSICALFIFLHLLKCNAERFAELCLGPPKHHAAHAHPTSHMFVSRVYAGLWHRTSFLARTSEPTLFVPVGEMAGVVVQLVHMAKETTLGEIGKLLERGFKAVADDIADLRKDMTTKEDMRAIVREELEPVEARLTSIKSELRSIRGDLDDLREKVENVSGFQKEIDHALERIGAIEKHLGIDKKIAA